VNKYDPKTIETKWQEKWEKEKLYEAKDSDERPKYYCLDMFPYPSGEGLHVGHWRGFVLSDVLARYAMLCGKNVLHPMGWDAFGLPAENAAIKNNSHPKVFTNKAITTFKKQLHQIGVVFDWSREINTSDPSYYKWTQWLFLKLYENKLAYRKKAPVNWCPNCQTVLANEQVVAGVCERCGSKVIKKDLTQWFFKITNFAEDLLKDLDSLDWPERTKTLQKNWIGKSEGTKIDFKVVIASKAKQSNNDKNTIEVFTTCADTLFGCTYLVLSPEHKEIRNFKSEIRNYNEVENYINNAENKSNIERESTEKEKTGVKLEGIKAINPINNEEIDIYIADYVLATYGTGAVMAVPAHDDRDFEFAKKYNIPIKMVICPNYPKPICPILEEAYEGNGHLVDSNNFNGLDSKEAQIKITQKLKEMGAGDFTVNYKLRDWLISRQRYWGAPIPIIYCDKCGEMPVPEKDLPVNLPENIEFKPHGESPLKQSETFLNTTCPKCGAKAVRETDTMDTFVDSSWYYIRYADSQNSIKIADENKIKKWLPVDLYVGGIEHAILHLLYARFISKALHNLKLIDFSPNGEPFTKLFNIGMIYLHGSKMSKSKGNIVSPDEIVEKYGTDALRGYELFIGPADQDSEWQVNGITGVYRFLEKVWDFYNNCKIVSDDKKDLVIEKTIQKVTQEIQEFRPNTALSNLMELFNYLKKTNNISKYNAQKINILLAPFFPHLAEEIWQKNGNSSSIFNSIWPKHDEMLAKDQKVTIAVQINGKTKGVIETDATVTQEKVEEMIKKNERLNKLIEKLKIKKTIYISGKVINFVVE